MHEGMASRLSLVVAMCVVVVVQLGGQCGGQQVRALPMQPRSMQPGSLVLREGRVITVKAKLPPAVAQANLYNHTFCFVLGAHHSGTTLIYRMLGQHQDISSITDSPAPEDEGQHLQSTYQRVYQLGSMRTWAHNPRAHMAEDDPAATTATAQALISDWGPYWDLSRKVLVEKSPRHTLMGRFFQKVFTPERSFFVMILRHPLGAYHFTPSTQPCNQLDSFLNHWLIMYKKAAEDARHLQHFMALHYEALTHRDTAEEELNKLFAALNVSQGMVPVRFEKYDPTRTYKPPLNLTGLAPDTKNAVERFMQQKIAVSQAARQRQAAAAAAGGGAAAAYVAHKGGQAGQAFVSSVDDAGVAASKWPAGGSVNSPQHVAPQVRSSDAQQLLDTLSQARDHALLAGPGSAELATRLQQQINMIEKSLAAGRGGFAFDSGGDAHAGGSSSGRHLLEYHSDTRDGVVVEEGMEYSWVPRFNATYGSDLRKSCPAVVEKYEAPLRPFGYSLLQSTPIGGPVAFPGHR